MAGMKSKAELKQKNKSAEMRTAEIHKFPNNTHLSQRINFSFLAAQLTTHFYIIHTRLYIYCIFQPLCSHQMGYFYWNESVREKWYKNEI